MGTGDPTQAPVSSGTRTPADRSSWVQRRQPGFFFWLNIGYLVVLLVLPVLRSADLPPVGPEYIGDPIGDVIPVGVPWFGALGAILISLYGVLDHNQEWDAKWNFWHMARPVAGVVLGTVAYLIFIGVVNATGATPTTGASAAEGSGPVPDSNLIPYYVIAFVVGFREHTFRALIQRAVDVLLGPGDSGSVSAAVVVSPSPIRFPPTAIGEQATVAVAVRNTGSASFAVGDSTAHPPGTGIEGETFSLRQDAVAGTAIAPNGSASLEVLFRPKAPGEHRGVLRISTSAGTYVVPVTGHAEAGRISDAPAG